MEFHEVTEERTDMETASQREAAELNAHRAKCSRKPVLPLRKFKCYWAEDGYWISCDEARQMLEYLLRKERI